jgi:hypothetical protein
MRILKELRTNKPLQIVINSAAISIGSLLGALIVGWVGFNIVSHTGHAAWATETATQTYSYQRYHRHSHVAAPAAPTTIDTPVVMPAVASVKIGLTDPVTNVSPSADFPRACYTTQQSATCDSIALVNINTARAAEGLAPMVLPANYYTLPLDQQILVVTNQERTARGLAAIKGLDVTLNSLALSGAQYNTDPYGPSGHSWASNWAGGEASALAADFSWMYDDGLGSNNIDCSAAASTGCWGHRHNILVDWTNLTMGVGTAYVGGWVSIAQLFVENW